MSEASKYKMEQIAGPPQQEFSVQLGNDKEMTENQTIEGKLQEPSFLSRIDKATESNYDTITMINSKADEQPSERHKPLQDSLSTGLIDNKRFEP